MVIAYVSPLTDTSLPLTYHMQGESGVRRLDNAGNNFERNQVDTFELECPDLGM